MPFGLDLKSLLIGIALAMFVWPFISSRLSGPSTANATKNTL